MDLNDFLDIPEIDNRDEIIKKIRNARETDSKLQIKMIILTYINFLSIETDLRNKLIKMLDHIKNHYDCHTFSPPIFLN